MKINLIVLAAGRSSRFKQDSSFTKMLIKILDKELIKFGIEAVHQALTINKTFIVVHQSKDQIKAALGEHYIYVEQPILNGTAGALNACLPYLIKGEYSLIINGDMPLISSDLIAAFIKKIKKEKSDCGLVYTRLDNPSSYGRIIESQKNIIIKEEKELTEKEKLIKEVNGGIYFLAHDLLIRYLPLIKEHQGEFYLPRLFHYLPDDHKMVKFYFDPLCLSGVNDFVQLSAVTKIIKERRNNQLMINGVYIENEMITSVGFYVTIEAGSKLIGYNYFSGNCHIETAVTIINTFLVNTNVKKLTSITNADISDTNIGENCQIGPYTHIRGKTLISDNARLGNFVEVKASTLGDGVKAAHLAYIGDALVGQKVNFGCGSVVANYDGKRKWPTEIGDFAFIGCNANLIAPITIGANAFIAAGSTINKTVPANALAIARSQQITKENYRGESDEKRDVVCFKCQQGDGAKDR